MAAPLSDVLTGATLGFASGYFARVNSVNWNGVSRPSVPTSHLATATMATFIPGRIVDPGEVEVELHFNPDTTPPWAGAAENFTITFVGGAAGSGTWVASGFMTNFAWRGGTDELMIATATLKFSANITVTPDT